MNGDTFTTAIAGLMGRLPARARFAVMASYSDEAIANLVRDGDTEAFGILVRRHENFVFTLVKGIVGSSEDAKDIAQEAFLRAYRAVRRFESRSSFKTWLYRIAYNTAMSHLKNNGARDLTLDEKVADQIPVKLAEPSLRLTLEHLIGNLKPDLKAVVILHYYDDLKYEEIAEIVGCPVGTVKIRLFRAKHELKKMWDKYAT